MTTARKTRSLNPNTHVIRTESSPKGPEHKAVTRKNPMSYFETAAEKVKQQGYQSGNRWERLLDENLRSSHPELVQAMGSDYSHFLIVQTSAALETFATLIEEGMDPMAAQELAMTEMMEVGIEEPEEGRESEPPE